MCMEYEVSEESSSERSKIFKHRVNGGNIFGCKALAGHKRRIPLAVVLPPPARGPGTLIPSAQRLVWAAKQPLGKAALGALFA